MGKTMVLQIKKCTEAQAHRVLQNNKWSVSLEQLEALIAIIPACSVSHCKNTGLQSLQSGSCKETAVRNSFCEIMWYFRLDEKSTHSIHWQTDKFALVSVVWNKFTENCFICSKPGKHTTAYKWLSPAKLWVCSQSSWHQNLTSMSKNIG
jgi:hypothetical protein